MYLSANRDTCRFMHKHGDFHVVCNLDFITTHLRPEKHLKEPWIEVGPIGHHTFLHEWSEAEKQKLYRNLTGQEKSPYIGTQLIGVLVELADRFPVSDVNPFEVEVQCNYIESKHPNGLGPKYQYVKGATTPMAGGDLFECAALPMSPEDAAVAARTRAPRAPAHTPATNTQATTARPYVPRTNIRKGGVREIVWQVADSMWEAAGKPIDKTQVLALRRSMMEKLDAEHGVKRTSSSNELGNWQKDRVK